MRFTDVPASWAGFLDHQPGGSNLLFRQVAEGSMSERKSRVAGRRCDRSDGMS
jgi:hypothetical protein